MERTKEMWTPRERWTPEQSRQNTVPNDTDALILICKTVNEYMNYYFVIWMHKHMSCALTIEDFSCRSRSICHCLLWL